MPILNKTVQFERKTSEIVLFVVVELTPIGIYVPWAIYIYFIYFCTDLVDEAFELPFPIW